MFDNLQINKKIFELEDKVRSIYGESHSKGYLNSVFRIFDPEGKTILDLGCGSVNSEDNTEYASREKLYEPWLLRALHEYGANCIGIDTGGLESEKFEGYSWELCNEDALRELESNSVDLACAFGFFDSPSLLGTGKRVFNILLPQLERIVKPEGYFLFEPLGTGYKTYINPSRTSTSIPRRIPEVKYGIAG